MDHKFPAVNNKCPQQLYSVPLYMLARVCIPLPPPDCAAHAASSHAHFLLGAIIMADELEEEARAERAKEFTTHLKGGKKSSRKRYSVASPYADYNQGTVLL